jgi:hypothetical protein
MEEWLENRPPLKDYLIAFIMVYGKKFSGFGEDGWLDDIPEALDEPRVYFWEALQKHGYLWRSKDWLTIKITAKGMRVVAGKETVPDDLILWN